MDANAGKGQLVQAEAEIQGQSYLNPSWLLKAGSGLGLLRKAGRVAPDPHSNPGPPTSGSMVPLTEAPRAKYQKILVLVCYSRHPGSGAQKAFVTWVFSGG